jgi:ankyrin repeat protein
VYEFINACGDPSLADLVKRSLSKYPSFVNSHSNLWYPLEIAIAYRNKETFHLLLENGADVNLKTAIGDTPLATAIKSGNLGCMRILINYGADPNKNGVFGAPPLLIATEENVHEAVKILLENGADPNASNDSFIFPLVIASELGYLEICNTLLDFGADPNQRSRRYGFVPLERAVVNGHTECVKSLLRPRYKKNEILWMCLVREYLQDSLFHDDYLPLDMFREIAKELSTKADLSLTCSNGSSIFNLALEYRHYVDYAETGGCDEILKILEDAARK